MSLYKSFFINLDFSETTEWNINHNVQWNPSTPEKWLSRGVASHQG